MKTGQALLRDINETIVPEDGLAFWWLGQVSYVVKVGDIVLYFDPFLQETTSRQIPSLLEAETIDHADWVFGSHDHMDHIDPVAISGIAQASPQSRFVVSRVARLRLLDMGINPSRIIALDEGMAHNDLNLSITPVAAKHEAFDHDPELGYPYLSYIVEIGGLTILHLGDTLCYEGLVTKLRPWAIDVMFVPINGRDAERYLRGCLGNMTYQEAVDLAGELSPRLTVPGHYDMFANNSQDPAPFAAMIEAKYPELDYWIGDHGEAVILPPRQAS